MKSPYLEILEAQMKLSHHLVMTGVGTEPLVSIMNALLPAPNKMPSGTALLRELLEKEAEEASHVHND